MNEPDSLERELAGYRPRPTSVALQQRIAEQLSPPPLALANSRSNTVWQASAVVGLLAASIVAIALWQGAPQPAQQFSNAIDPDLMQAFDASTPSAWRYGRALTQSPDAVNALLDAQAYRQRVTREQAKPLFLLAYSHLDSGDR